MKVPGSNLLKQALRVIAGQTVTYYAYASRETNAIGLINTEFSPGKTISGSFQPVPRNKYQDMGLDFQRSYYVFYASRDVIDLGRDVSGDQLEFQGRRFQCESKTDWFGIDGWDGVLCVQIDLTGEACPC